VGVNPRRVMGLDQTLRAPERPGEDRAQRFLLRGRNVALGDVVYHPLQEPADEALRRLTGDGGTPKPTTRARHAGFAVRKAQVRNIS
jgi:hypothetical protein